MKTLKV